MSMLSASLVAEDKTYSEAFKTLNFVEPGKVKRIQMLHMPIPSPSYMHFKTRHAVCVSPQFSNRTIEAARSVLNRYIPNIYLYSNVYKGEESGKCGHFVP